MRSNRLPLAYKSDGVHSQRSSPALYYTLYFCLLTSAVSFPRSLCATNTQSYLQQKIKITARSQPPLDCGFTPQAQGHEETKKEVFRWNEKRKRKSKLWPLNPAWSANQREVSREGRGVGRSGEARAGWRGGWRRPHVELLLWPPHLIQIFKPPTLPCKKKRKSSLLRASRSGVKVHSRWITREGCSQKFAIP